MTKSSDNLLEEMRVDEFFEKSKTMTDEEYVREFSELMGVEMTKTEAFRAIADHGVTAQNIMAVMPINDDETEPHYNDRELLEEARDNGVGLSTVLSDAIERGDNGFVVDLIGWLEHWLALFEWRQQLTPKEFEAVFTELRSVPGVPRR
jgi:hypothetical protein